MPRLPSPVTPVDAVLGVLLGWLGWVSAHLVWQQPEIQLRGPRGPGRFQGHDQPELPVWSDISWVVPASLVPVVLGVALRRRWPRIAFVAVVVGLTGYRATGAGVGPVFLALALGVFAMATVHPVRRWAPFTVGLVPIALAGHWTEPALGLFNPALYAELVGGLTVAVLPAMFALLNRTRRDNERREREQDRRRYADEERLRIAREVHDVVGHSLSVITMQAGVALHLLEKRPPDRQLSESMEAIRRTSKDALTELRTTLEVFREPGGGAPHGLRPGLARLDELVAALVAAGREVQVVREPRQQPPLPTAVDEAAFRIVQEALTNVVRHTGSARAIVTLTRRPDDLLVEVVDDGPAQRPPDAGNGILGMDERARAVGGRVTIETVTPHGLRVSARLPVEQAA